MAIALRFAARSDVGLLREGNEDSGYAGPRLLVVCDGVGGHAAGEVASSVAVATLSYLDEDPPGPDFLDDLKTAVRVANDRLRDVMDSNPRMTGMGTTLTALLRSGSRFALAHVGDSRCYLLRNDEFQQVTRDHTFVQTLVDEGRITAEEAGSHPQRSLILNALDGRDGVDMDESIREARVGDRWLLCTDGLSGVVSESTMKETLAARRNPDETAETLVELALRGGGPDNVTVILADVVDSDSAPSIVPQVVGAATDVPIGARNDGASGAARSSAAARAAALMPRRTAADQDDVPETHRGRSWWRPLLLVVVVLGLVGGLGAAGYSWSKRQFYIGSDEGNVAIYRGLSQNVLGLHLSTLYKREDIALTTLSDFSRGQVEHAIPANDLGHAERIVARLAQESETCRNQPGGSTTPSPSPSALPATGTPRNSAQAVPSPTTGGGTSATPSATPSPRPTTAPATTPPPSSDERRCPGTAS